MSTFLLNILLALAWGALTGSFEPINLFFGFALGFLMIGVGERTLTGNQGRYLRASFLALELLFLFLVDFIRANLRMVKIVLAPKPDLKPAVVAVPLSIRSETAITLLVNMITLTPGTLSLDVSNDRKLVFVHVFYLDDVEDFRRKLKEKYERRIQDLFEP